MKESTTYQAILEEGRAEGALAEARKILILLGSSRFGPPDGAMTAALEGITDVERLEELGVCVLVPNKVAGWEELLSLPAPQPRSRRRPKA
jgi:hypothetical protein